MLGDISAVVTVTAHANEAAVIAVVVLAASSIVSRLVGIATVVAADTSRRSRTCGESRVAAQHGDTRAVLGATKGYHVLANVSSNDLATLRISVGKDVLNEVVAELVASNVDKRHARAVRASFADDIKVAVKEV